MNHEKKGPTVAQVLYFIFLCHYSLVFNSYINLTIELQLEKPIIIYNPIIN